MHKDCFAQRIKIARRVKIARLSVLYGGSKLHGDNIAQNTTNLKCLRKNFQECLFTIKKIILKID